MANRQLGWRQTFQHWISTHRWLSVIIAAAVYAILVGLIPGLLQHKGLTQILLAMGSWGALGLIVFGVLFRSGGAARTKEEPHHSVKRSQQPRRSKKSRGKSRASRRH
jgi:hypothetical protein